MDTVGRFGRMETIILAIGKIASIMEKANLYNSSKGAKLSSQVLLSKVVLSILDLFSD